MILKVEENVKENIANKFSQFKSVIYLPSIGFAKNLNIFFTIIIIITVISFVVDAIVIIIFLHKTDAVSSYLLSSIDGQNTHIPGSQYSETHNNKMLHFPSYFVPYLLQL